MNKIIVIGCPGSGKSYFTKKLSEKLNIEKYHLDVMFWKENWTKTPKDEFIEKIKEVLREDSFILDGNYNSSLELRICNCDTIFFLDLPTEVCLASEKARRGKKRDDFPFYLSEKGEDIEFTNYIRNFQNDNRPYIMNLLNKYKEKDIIVFKSRNEVNNYLNNI